MRRAEIDRWTAKRLRQIPPPKGFLIRRGERDVEAFKPEEAAEVSGFCRPGDIIMAIMPDDSVGLTYEVDSGAGDNGAAGVTGAVVKVVGEQLGRVNEGVSAGYEGVIAAYRDELKRCHERIQFLEQKIEKLQAANVEVLRIQKEYKIEEAALALEELKQNQKQKMMDENLGKAFHILGQVIGDFVEHRTKKDKLKAIFDKLSEDTVRGLAKDLNEEDLKVISSLVDDDDDKDPKK